MMYYPLRALQKTNLLKLFNLQVESEYADRRYKIPIMNNIGLVNLKPSELWMKDLIIKLFKCKKGVFIDVGANIGQTLMKLRSFSSVTYIGMEPNPECVVYLEKLIKMNNLTDCVVCPVGLSNKNGLLTLYSSAPASQKASFINSFSVNEAQHLTHSHIVPVMRGDDILSSLNLKEGIAVIKIDVEEAELEVIDGLQYTLQSFRPFIISEILPVYSLDRQNGMFRKERQDRLIELLKTNNYSVFRILDGNKFEPISQIEVHSSLDLSNYVFIPKEMEKDFFDN